RATYVIERLEVGRTNEETSHLRLRVSADTPESLASLLAALSAYGCYVEGVPNALLREADLDGAAPEDFYSTTNHRTEVRLDGRWTSVEQQRMDAAIVVHGGRAVCRKLRDIRRGDAVVCGMHGVRVQPDIQSRERPSFGFMASEVSSERRAETAVARVADLLRAARAQQGRIAFVVGP